MDNKMTTLIKEYNPSELSNLCYFLEKCLPESGRTFEPEGAHAELLHVEKTYDYFICLTEQETLQIIGTCALKKINEQKCELKCVYLYPTYYGQRLGTKMSKMVIDKARELGYQEMY